MVFGVVYKTMHSLNNSSQTKYQDKALHQPKVIHKKASIPVKQNVNSKSELSVSCLESEITQFGSVPRLSSQNPVNVDLIKRKDKKRHDSFRKKAKLDSLLLKQDSHSESNQSKLLKSSVPNTYVCKYCCRQLKSKEQLQQHILIHHSKATHVCYVCNHQAGTFSALMTHYLKHSGPNASKIEKLNTSVQENGPGIKDDPSSNKSIAHYCQMCKLHFTSQQMLNAHKCPKSLVKNEYKCTYCGRVSSTVDDYRICVQSHTETPFICPSCKKKFPRKKQLDLHVQGCRGKDTDSKLFICNICKDFRCNCVKELASHQKKCKPTENFACKECNLEFSGKECFEEHLDFCEPEFKQKSPSKAKILPKTTRKYVRKKVRYSCSSCNAPFFLKTEYVRHEKSCVKVPSFDDNENVSRACSKCSSMIPIGKFAEHAKECTGKASKEVTGKEDAKDLCCNDGAIIKKPEIVKLKSCPSQNAVEPKPKPKRRTRKKIALHTKKNETDNDQQDVEMSLESEKGHVLKRRLSKKIVASSDDEKDNIKSNSTTEAHSKVEQGNGENKNLGAESNFSKDGTEPMQKSESKPKRRRRRKRKIVYDSDENQDYGPEQDINVINATEVGRHCDMSRNAEFDVSANARRSRRKISRKNSFMDDEKDNIQEKKQKLAKKPKITLKPKFRRGKYSNESNRSFLCSICDFAFCSKSTLLRHKRMHSGNPWYACKYCGKFFFRKDVYVRHETNVHKDSEKVMFCCCYCKLCYNDSFSLKKHVMEVHKESAFLPNKPKFLTKKELDSREIKQEPLEGSEEVVNNLNDSEPSEQTGQKNLASEASDSLYKCSVCSETFETASLAGSHMSTHPKNEVVEEIDAIEEKKYSLSVQNDQTSVRLNVSKEPVSGPTSDAEPSTLPGGHLDPEKALEKVQDKTAVDKIMPDEHMIQVESYKKLVCLLCMQKFSDKSLLDAHSKSDHKLIEWYQCLVCSACGSKSDMVEHMFSHMYKVGSFVVNCSNKSLDALLPCLELDKTSSSANNDQSKTGSCLNNAAETDLVSELELPPLREYGLCLCMKNVSRNNEVQDFVNEVTKCNGEDNCARQALDDISMCSSPSDENIPCKLKTVPVLSCDDAVAANQLQVSDQDASETMELSDEEPVELEQPILSPVKSKEVNPTIASEGPFSDSNNKDPDEPASLETSASELKDNVVSPKKDSSNEESNHSPSLPSVEPTDNASNSLNEPIEKERKGNPAIYSSDLSSSSDENSVASNSSNTSEENETQSTGKLSSTEGDENKTDCSSSDSSSEDNDSENEDSPSESSSSEEKEFVSSSPPSSPTIEESVKGLNLTPASVSFEKDSFILRDACPSAAAPTPNKEQDGNDALLNEPIKIPESEKTLKSDPSSLLSKNPSSNAVDPFLSSICSDSENRGITLDFTPPFGQKRHLKTNLVPPNSSAISQIEKPPELCGTNATSMKHPASQVSGSVASSVSSVLDVQSSFGHKGQLNTDVMNPIISSTTVNNAEFLLDAVPSAHEKFERLESSILSSKPLLKDPTCSVIKSLSSVTCSDSAKRGYTVDFQPSFGQMGPQTPDLAKPITLSYLGNMIGIHDGVAQLTEKIPKLPESNVTSRDPIFNVDESFTSTTCFTSVNTTNAPQDFNLETLQANIVEPMMSSSNSKAGKSPELLKSNIVSRDPTFRTNERLVSTSCLSSESRRNLEDIQSELEMKEAHEPNSVKPMLSSYTSKKGSPFGVLQSGDKIPELSKPSIVSSDPIFSASEPLVSNSCFSSGNAGNMTVQSALEKKEQSKSNVVKRVNSNLGSHLGVFQLAEKMPELFKSHTSAKDSFARMNKTSAAIAGSIKKRNSLALQSDFNEKEPLNPNISKPMPNSSWTNDPQTPGGILEPRDKALESLKAVISPQIENCEKTHLPVISNLSSPDKKSKNLCVSSSVIDFKKTDMSLTKKLFQKDIETLSKESMASANLSPFVKPMKNEANVLTSQHSSHANELPLNLQKSRPVQNSAPGNFSQLRSLLQKPSKMESEKITIYPFSYSDTHAKQGEISKMDSEKITLYPASYTDSSVKQGAPMPPNVESEKITIYPLSYTESSANQESSVPSKMDSEKITIYPLSYTDSSVKQGGSTPFVKCISSIENPELFSSTFMLDNKCDFTAESSVVSSNLTKGKQSMSSSSLQITSPNQNVTQSKSPVVSSNPIPYLPPKPPEREDSFFKPCSSQSPILDFSDLIQHSFENPSPSEENIFSFPETIKSSDLYPCSDEIQIPVDLTNFDSPAISASSKCNNCNTVFSTSEQLANHKCLLHKTVKHIDSPFIAKPKNTFQSLNFQVPPALVQSHSQHEKLFLPPSSSKTAETFLGTKTLPSEFRFKTAPHQNTHITPPSSSKCNNCQSVFSDIGELMKHSLSCLKPLFARNHLANDCLTTAGAMQPLLLKEPVTSFSNFAFNLTFPSSNTLPGSTTTYQNFENAKHPFNS